MLSQKSSSPRSGKLKTTGSAQSSSGSSSRLGMQTEASSKGWMYKKVSNLFSVIIVVVGREGSSLLAASKQVPSSQSIPKTPSKNSSRTAMTDANGCNGGDDIDVEAAPEAEAEAEEGDSEEDEGEGDGEEEADDDMLEVVELHPTPQRILVRRAGGGGSDFNGDDQDTLNNARVPSLEQDPGETEGRGG